MKVTLDLTKLLEEGKITQAEFEKFSQFSSRGTASLAFNILIGFGVIAVSGASLALVPTPAAAIFLGAVVAAVGVMLAQTYMQQWGVLAKISILVGALLFGGGVLLLDNGSVGAFLLVAVIYSAAGVVTRNGLLIVLAVLALSSSIGMRTGYMHAMYFLGIQEPTLTIFIFSCLGFVLYQLSQRVAADYERLALMGARASVFLVNFGFWIGSLWGDRLDQAHVVVSRWYFVMGWAAALFGAAVWAASRNRRWVLNTVATFGAIHFYTQWFEHLGANPSTVLVAGVLAIGFATGIWQFNRQAKEAI
jgi:hypothetical protein